MAATHLNSHNFSATGRLPSANVSFPAPFSAAGSLRSNPTQLMDPTVQRVQRGDLAPAGPQEVHPYVGMKFR